MERIVFATGNKGKLREIREILADLPYEVVSMAEAGIDCDIIEDGTSYEENSLIKVRTIRSWLEKHGSHGCIVMADDSGFEVDHLNKEPGIYSARYMGEDTSYDIKNQAILDRMAGVGDGDRTARFVCAIALVLPDGEEHVIRETMEGSVAYRISGEGGFGYDPIFICEGYDRTNAEDPSIKMAVGHRAKALNGAKKYLAARVSAK